MKKKLIQSFMLLIVAVSVGSFVSCKDTNEGLYTQLRTQAIQENATLQAAFEAQIAALEGQITTYKQALDALEATFATYQSCNCDQTLPATISGLTAQIATLNSEVATLQAGLANAASKDDVNTINTTIASLTAQLSGLQNTLDNLLSQFTPLATEFNSFKGAQEIINGTVTDLQNELNQVKADLANINQCQCDYAYVTSKLVELETKMTAAEQRVKDAYDLATTANTKADAANTTANAANATANEAKLTAQQALDAATAATNAATSATQAAQQAVTTASLAEQAALAAGLTANEAKQFAQEAQTNANLALQTANAANALATVAQTTADAALTLANANKTEIELLKQKAATIEQNMQTLQTLISQNAAAIAQNAQDIAQNTSDIANNSTLIQKNIQDIANNTQEIANNASKIQENANKIQQNADAIAAIQTQLVGLPEKVQQALDAAAAAAGKADANFELITGLSSTIETMRTTISGLEAANATNTANISNLETAINELKTNVQTFNETILDKVTTNENSITELRTNLQNLTNTVNQTQTTITQLSQKVNTLESDLNTLRGELAQVKIDCDLNLIAAQRYADEAIAAAQTAILGQVATMLQKYAKATDLLNYATQTELNESKEALNKRITELMTQMLQEFRTEDGKIADLATLLSAKISRDSTDIAWLKEAIKQLNGKFDNYATKESLQSWFEKITNLETQMANLDRDQLISELTEIITNDILDTTDPDGLGSQIQLIINQALRDSSYISEIADLVQPLIDTAEYNDSVLTDSVKNHYADIVALTKRVEALESSTVKIEDYKLDKESIWKQINTNETNISNLKTTVKDITDNIIPGLQQDIKKLQNRMTAAEGRLDNVEKDIQQINKDVAAVQNQLAKQVTGIIIQGTKNPMFGTFNLPIDVQSNLLIAYYGVPFSSFEFPTDDTAPYGVRSDQALTSDEINMLLGLGLEQYEHRANMPLLSSAEGNAGKVYMTINPNTADLEGLELSLVNTQDKESPIKLKPIRKSDEKLQFGYTRADNGFYEADAYVTNATVMTEDNGIPLTKEDIRTAFGGIKDKLTAILNRKANEKGELQIGQIASDVYNVINKMKMDRTGLKCTYTTTDASGAEQKHSVYSEYNLGATFINPLSLDYGKDFDYVTMPGYETVENFINNLAQKVKDKVHVACDRITHAQIVNMILNFQINRIEAPDLPTNLVNYPQPGDLNQDCGKFYLKMDTTFTMDGISYFLQIPVDAQRVPVKFANDLNIGGTPITVPDADAVNVRPFRSTYNQDNEGKPTDLITLTKPTVVVWNNETTGNVESILVIPMKDHQGSIKGYVQIDMEATIETTVAGGKITLKTEDATDVATIAGGVLTPTSTQYVNMTEVYYAGTTDGKEFHLAFHYDLRDAAEQLWGLAQGSIEDVNDLLQRVQKIIDEARNVVEQINNYMGPGGKIDQTIDNAVNTYLIKYLDKVNDLVVGFVNSINRRLQPFMVARTSKGFKRVSEIKAQPTVLSSDVELFPTTKTMELLVPIARKHVAVTNVFRGSASAQDGNNDCMDKLEAANSGYLNKVFDGNKRYVKATGLVSGYVYEIAYSVLDFDGNMSTHRYYIRIE
ncbi:MAG: hypothetical protein IKQ37_09280 [Bacteroidaceae bacterium]|nr:hypothetical protein [Bacteroidaceae bacterium]